ncbi:MAG: tetratricopeptide repeat protein [Flavobacteriales bacterium]|nr:hypothetical protein [Flavobacteriales bacterium]MCC6578052.1 tetratricopeptide repeat protein [Flavobacteriales bacterium]NUQ16196.1 tetratricopeptide repeat protein [Flavobacteriales bacterium]
MRAVFTLLIVCLVIGARAQEDSLLRVLRGLPNDTTRLPVLTELIRATVFSTPDDALAHAQEYTRIAAAARSDFHIGKGENFQGMCYATQSRYDEAMEHYSRALERFERVKDQWYTAMLHNNIGGVLIEQGRLDKALVRFGQARAGFMAARDTIWTANVLNNLGNIHQENGNYDSAAVIYQQAATTLDAIGQTTHAASAWLNLGNSHAMLGDSLDALADFQAALDRTAHNEDDHTRTMAFLGKGRMLMAMARWPEAHRALDSGLFTARSMGNAQQIARAHEDLASWFESTGRLDSALRHQRSYSQWRDSVFTEERMAAITEMQEKYESNKKDLRLREKEAQLQRRSFTIKAVAAGAVLLLLAALFAYRAYRIKRRGEAALAGKNATIEAQLREKELLLREIHHRVKNNLQTVSSLLSIQGRGITDEKAKEAVNDSRLRVKSMALIHQDLYREGDLTGVRMKDYVEKLVTSLITSYAMSDRVKAVLDVDDIALDVDTAVPIGLVLNELVTNALKYAWPQERPGRLTVTLRLEGEVLRLLIADDGVGRTGTSGDERASGFGLNMVRTFATKLKAEWAIDHGHGTTVDMRIRIFKLAH